MNKYFLLLVSLSCAFGVVSGLFKAKVKNKWFVDDYGRVRLYHGINAVAKGFPWIPNYGHINLKNASMLNDFQSWGFNMVRLGVMWSGLMPTKDFINMTYLNEMIEIINGLATRDMYVIVDLHQDMLSTKYGAYDGAPRWLIDLMPNSVMPYPWPFTKTDLGFAAYLTEACGFGFQSLYSNRNGFADYFAEFWSIVANAFANLPNIFGYELINEPWAGDIYSDPLLL
jgi:endoglycosylceramidase